MIMIIAALGLIGVTADAVSPGAATLSDATRKAFQRYIEKVEAAATARGNGSQPFLWSDASKDRLQRLRGGATVIERSSGSGPVKVDGGLIHDWTGAVFIPGVTLAETLALVQDYAHHKDVYPEVIDSKLLSRDGDHFVIFLKLRKKKVIEVVLDTTHEAQYSRVDANRVRSWSRTTRVAEVDAAGTPQEREKPPGNERGFMWFLNSYWRFAERDGGVYVECQAVSLSRDIPMVLRLLPFVSGVINDLPRESLEGTLTSTRTALLAAVRKARESRRPHAHGARW
jgi:hypothetical protein